MGAPRYAYLWQTGWIPDAVNWTDYNDRNNLDSLGATLRSSERMIWSLPVVANRVKPGHDDSYYSYSLSRTLNKRNLPLYQYHRNQLLLAL